MFCCCRPGNPNPGAGGARQRKTSSPTKEFQGTRQASRECARKPANKLQKKSRGNMGPTSRGGPTQQKKEKEKGKETKKLLPNQKKKKNRRRKLTAKARLLNR